MYVRCSMVVVQHDDGEHHRRCHHEHNAVEVGACNTASHVTSHTHTAAILARDLLHEHKHKITPTMCYENQKFTPVIRRKIISFFHHSPSTNIQKVRSQLKLCANLEHLVVQMAAVFAQRFMVKLSAHNFKTWNVLKIVKIFQKILRLPNARGVTNNRKQTSKEKCRKNIKVTKTST